MSHCKKPVSLLLSLIMVLSLFAVVPFSASAATDDYTYTVANGEATITGYTGSDPTATIPAVIDGCPVTKIGDRAFYESSSVKSVILPDNVKEIGNFVFSGCTQLESISIPKTLTTVAPYAFDYCTALKNVTFEEGTTRIPDNLFFTGHNDAHVGLEQITFPASVTEIGQGAFYGCEYLSEVNFAGDAVKRIEERAFSGAKSLTSIDLPDHLEFLGNGAFGGNGFTSIEIPKSLTTADATYHNDGPFAGSYYLTTATFEEGTTKIVDNLFRGCYSLQSFIVPDAITEIGDNAFRDCENLESVTIPATVTAIGSDAFAENANLTIYGYADSYAQLFAAKKGIKFVNIGAALLGDADSDGDVNIIDATVIQRFLAGIQLERFDEAAADVDADGEATIIDVTFLSRFLAGVPTSCVGIGEPMA